MADEFARIARLRKLFASTRSVVGIGDDAAVLASGPDNLVLSVDSQVEHVHFERHFATLSALSARAFTAAISDLAAMGARASSALSALIIPPALSEAEFDALIEGLAAAATRYDCPIIGGNLSAGSELSITTTVIGAVRGTGLLRAGAQPGDRICVTGTLGGAALGLALLQRSAAERGPSFVARWLAPTARMAEGQQLLGFASAAIDISDGLLQDLGHLCEASGLGAELEAALLPLESGLSAGARALGNDPLVLALSGGEDYELLYTVPEHSELGPGTCIGRMSHGPGPIIVRDAHGGIVSLPGHGYRHFTR